MSTPESPISPALLEQARQWRVRLNSGKVSSRQAEEFRQWCTRSAEHAQAWKHSAQLWDDLTPNLQQILTQHPSLAVDARVTQQLRHRHRLQRRALLGAGMAASLSGFLLIKPPLDLWPSLLESGADFKTATGEQKKIVLGNVATVQLNTRTRLNWHDSPEQSAVELLAGEAELDIHRTLAVRAGQGVLQIEHARINLRWLSEQQVCVSCLRGQGSVQLEKQYVFEQGEQLIYDAAGLVQRRPADLTQVSAWRQGMLSFADVPLHEVVAEINRYRPGKVIISNRALSQRQVRLVVPIDETDRALQMLGELYQAKLLHLPGDIVVIT